MFHSVNDSRPESRVGRFSLFNPQEVSHFMVLYDMTEAKYCLPTNKYRRSFQLIVVHLTFISIPKLIFEQYN